MDLPYLRTHPQHLPTFLTHQRIRETPVGGGDVCRASRLTLDDGSSLFAKTWPAGEPPEHFFATEAAGLNWLREAGTVPVPEVIVALDKMLALEWVDSGPPTRAGAERFGRELADLHRAGAESFGAAWTGFIGPLPQDNTPSAGPWGEWFAERRMRPYLKISADRGALSGTDVTLVERVLSGIETYGGKEPPARIHGDLWPGNVLWGADGRIWLVDPAAHGGHRETDLAQLALFGGVAHLDAVISAYDEVWPLGEGWRERVALHQLHLLLVHTAAFGKQYREAVRAAAGALLGH
ncbi:fructosamine kinase family protein [Couchioplanes caeruleus]|uniref:Aminoglycoside phosphotransferase n=2 Tax=Couchioplanes caeruleus TaxID=56438 RepID=A0A1K0GWQ6_9ACTN|nr:fructosamine kinase family protein [Couchioplanes caeruleus]OJF13843.1 aminoglycoside phosphotransferase [Couchioplanes caeruleus subsp. caeruleus]ROP31169.1 fructosamine-3-kinase [Couchioplanes caeruleus]